ncbi:YceI family protein [Archangium violaceum]|uniref:YceI family protein n=1 Tax=Archangium violaceum TaxID=83451 RepID=UPI00194E6731|nr:YceI family protein [Archangium violaceum]QRN95398.1 YceI family protein [Archangium violaceum]
MKRLVPLLMTLAWAGAVAAQPGMVLQPGGELAIDGTSTVRDFTCKAQGVTARLTPGEGGGALVLEQLAGAVREGVLEVPAGRLDCANGTMNEHMYNALRTRQHPTIRFQMSGYEVGAVKDGQVPLHIHGELTLAGVTKPIDLDVRATQTPEGGLRVRGRYTLRMPDWGVRPPTLMLGTLKVGESVVIRFDFALQRQ